MGNEAIGVYIRCGTYAARHLTDGYIPRQIALLYGTEALAAQLVGAKLWHRTRGGWMIHDYLDYNPSKEAVEKDRQQKAERQKRWREARRRRVTNPSADASRDVPPPRPERDSGAGTAPRAAANGRADPPGSAARGRKPKPPWCGMCDRGTRLTGPADQPYRCPNCHPLNETRRPL